MHRRTVVQRHPVLVFAVAAIVPTWAIQFLFLANGWELFPALLAELVFLLAAAAGVTAATDGRAGVRRLFAGALRWRFGVGRFAVVLLAMPALTLAVSAVSGSIRTPAAGWAGEASSYLFMTLIYGAMLGNVWEETAWAGFAQSRLMARHGLLRGSLLTAIPFALIHLPLAFETGGLGGTGGRDLAITWAVLVAFAPLVRYLYGTFLIDSGGSVLAVGIVHASFNASQKLGAVHGQWQVLVAVVVFTVLVVAYRRSRGLSATAGHAPALRSADEERSTERERVQARFDDRG
jgi:membrane protease YdiL (CAAX protease family)